MPKRSSKTRQKDTHELARHILDTVVPDAEPAEPKPVKAKNPAAVALGRLAGKVGGKARAAKLTAEQRREIAQKAARKRRARKPGGGTTQKLLGFMAPMGLS